MPANVCLKFNLMRKLELFYSVGSCHFLLSSYARLQNKSVSKLCQFRTPIQHSRTFKTFSDTYCSLRMAQAYVKSTSHKGVKLKCYIIEFNLWLIMLNYTIIELLQGSTASMWKELESGGKNTTKFLALKLKKVVRQKKRLEGGGKREWMKTSRKIL